MLAEGCIVSCLKMIGNADKIWTRKTFLSIHSAGREVLQSKLYICFLWLMLKPTLIYILDPSLNSTKKPWTVTFLFHLVVIPILLCTTVWEESCSHLINLNVGSLTASFMCASVLWHIWKQTCSLTSLTFLPAWLFLSKTLCSGKQPTS